MTVSPSYRCSPASETIHSLIVLAPWPASVTSGGPFYSSGASSLAGLTGAALVGCRRARHPINT